MSAARIIGIPSNAVGELWPMVLPLIAEAVKTSNGRYHAEDVREAIAARDMQLWVIVEGESMKAVVVTQIVSYPRAKACRIICGTGADMASWHHLIADLEAYAKARNCTLFESIAREGWARVFAPRGYRKSHVFIEKDL